MNILSLLACLLCATGGIGLFVTTRPGNRRFHAQHQERLRTLRCHMCGAPWQGYPLCTSCKRTVDVPQPPRDLAPWIMLASFLPLITWFL